MTRVFKTKKELIERLIAGEKWKTIGSNYYCYYDESYRNPFRYSTETDMYGIWDSCDGERLWEQVIDKTKN